MGVPSGRKIKKIKQEDERMNCWQCKHELIWGGDHTGEDYGNEEYEIVSNLSCPECEAFVLVYWSKKEEPSVEASST